MDIGSIRPMADEVASLMVARYGGARRGHHVDLDSMLKRRGGALPRKLRREAKYLAEADRLAGQPKLARQVDLDRLGHAHQTLTHYLRPLGQGMRLRGGVIDIAASLLLGLLVLGGVVLWIMSERGML